VVSTGLGVNGIYDKQLFNSLMVPMLSQLSSKIYSARILRPTNDVVRKAVVCDAKCNGMNRPLHDRSSAEGFTYHRCAYSDRQRTTPSSAEYPRWLTYNRKWRGTSISPDIIVFPSPKQESA